MTGRWKARGVLLGEKSESCSAACLCYIYVQLKRVSCDEFEAGGDPLTRCNKSKLVEEDIRQHSRVEEGRDKLLM